VFKTAPGVMASMALPMLTTSPPLEVKRNDKGKENPLLEEEASCQYPHASLGAISIHLEEEACWISIFMV